MSKRSRLLELKRKKLGRERKGITRSSNHNLMVFDTPYECPIGYKEWPKLGVPSQIVRGIVELGFVSPTEIQQKVIPAALNGDADVVGAAETGSGKTLAFGIPILNYILSDCPPSSFTQRKENTVKRRKLDKKEKIQITEDGKKMVDINEVVFFEDEYREDGEENVKRKRNEQRDIEEEEGDLMEEEPSVGLVMSEDFIPDDVFERSLCSGKRDLVPDMPPVHDTPTFVGKEDGMVALILTPTRELAMQIKTHIDSVSKYTGIHICSVIGGMSSQKQERLLNLKPQIVIATPGRLWKMIKEDENPHLNNMKLLKFLVLDEADRMIEHGHFNELSLILEKISTVKPPGSYRTMVFSATLTLPRQNTKGKKAWKVQSGDQSVENLINRTTLSEDAVVIDLSTKKGTVDRLTETKLMCSSDEKDVYLYYTLLACKGRTLVFTNSLDCLNRLKSLLEALKLHPLPLHARMQQRQRLKNLDRFTSNCNGLMVASDVAARGLDIPQVEHVVHYQTPKNSEVYVHRSGRTARGKSEGTSIMLVAPEDLQGYRNICRTLNREQELDNFPIDVSILKPLRQRVNLAKKLDSEEHKLKRSSRNDKWLEQTAKAMDIILDEEFENEKDEKLRDNVERKSLIYSLRIQLNQMLSEEVIPGDVSYNFPSMSSLKLHKNTMSTIVEKLKRKTRAVGRKTGRH